MSFDAERAASSLLEVRMQHRQLEPFSPGPATAAEAYAVQGGAGGASDAPP
jgi:hypothetical protein